MSFFSFSFSGSKMSGIAWSRDQRNLSCSSVSNTVSIQSTDACATFVNFSCAPCRHFGKNFFWLSCGFKQLG